MSSEFQRRHLVPRGLLSLYRHTYKAATISIYNKKYLLISRKNTQTFTFCMSLSTPKFTKEKSMHQNICIMLQIGIGQGFS